ncbi:MAG TPA: hypothetical protein DIW52_04435, partial [Pseudomonas sp.]|nr:hypothetical protein [Pseudomonas sp.]
IEQGQISKLLWSSQEVASDSRTASVGDPHLVFVRHHTLYASYSEIQWTAYKCSQVLKDNTERERLMQRIEPAGACPVKGGTDLLSKQQAEKWLAEVAENTPKTDAKGVTLQAPVKALPEGANPQERQPYGWEDKPLFQETAIEALTSQVLGPYQNDYLFLVLRDDIGVMRDLASAQLKVADWIEQWSADDAGQRQYLTGAYIQSLYEVNPTRLEALSATDPEVEALKEDTTSEQQAAIYEHLQARRESGGPSRYDDVAFWRNSPNPGVQAWFRMYDALGDVKWQKHAKAIDQLERQSKDALYGDKIGQRGIDDLVNRADMEAFVSQQQQLLNHWHQRLAAIREDRLHMITGGYFHRAAWYYDFEQNAQIQQRLEAEFVCVAALCGNRAATEKLAAFLEQNPLTVVPGLETLTLADQLDVSKKLLDLSNFSIQVATAQDSLASVN